jgi:hypothetical protein
MRVPYLWLRQDGSRGQRSPCRVAVLQVKALEDGLEVVFLGHVKLPGRAVSVDFETKKVAGGSRVRAFKLRNELTLEVVQGRAVVCYNTITTKQCRSLRRPSVDTRLSTTPGYIPFGFMRSEGRRIGRPRLGKPEGRDSMARRASTLWT